MGFWDRFGKRRPAPPSTPEPAPETPEPRAEASLLERLARVGAADGPSPDEALSFFRALRATPEEASAIDVVRAASRSHAVGEPLRVAAAAALVDRGEPDDALVLLTARGACVSPEARVLAADLRADRGELPEALALVERVLVADLDYPGARERHARWRAALGLERAPSAQRDAASATVVAREPDAPFVLLREVARGGAGVVYEAEDRELLRRVALKVYHHPERDRAQLLHEARVANSMGGKGVIRVLDLDPDHGWLALEWAALGSLRHQLRADASVLDPVARWAVPLAAALAHVHAAGWVHNDVKPANVLLASPAAPLLADFGIARRAGEPAPPGSLGYVSPERLAGRASDPRDDVFGFGRILEDVLAAAPAARSAARWHVFAEACSGPDAQRPGDGRALVTRLRVELAAAAVGP